VRVGARVGHPDRLDRALRLGAEPSVAGSSTRSRSCEPNSAQRKWKCVSLAHVAQIVADVERALKGP
jgi:hypothetical protein